MKKKLLVPALSVGLAAALALNSLALMRAQNTSVDTLSEELNGTQSQSLLLSSGNNGKTTKGINPKTGKFEFEEKGYKNSWEELLAEDGFVYGIDYNYCGDNVNFAFSLGSNHLLNRSSTWDSYIATTDINNIKALGFNCTSYWLLQDGQGIQFNDDGIATGIDEEFIKNFTELLDICRTADIKLLPTLVPHGTAGNYGDGGPAGTPNEILNKYFRFMWEENAQKEFLKNVIDPVLDVIVQYQDVVPCVAVVVENATQMVNDVEAGYYEGDNGTTWEKWCTFVNALHDAVKAKMPNMYTSIEEAGVVDDQSGTHEKLYRQNEDLKVDFISENYYHNGGWIEQHDVGYTTRPGYIGEMNGGGPASDPNMQEYYKNIKNNFHKSAKEGGWMGGFFFSFKAGGVDYQLMSGATTEYESFFAWAINFRYTITDGINEFKGKERDAVEKSYLFANKGGKEVYWIPGRGAETFEVQRSLDGGKNWVTLAKNIDLYENSIDNGLVKYVDETLKEGMNYCYRIVSIGEDGTRVIGDANNSEDFFVPKNLLTEADAGFENDGANGKWVSISGGKITDEDKHSGKYSWVVDKSDTATTSNNYGAAEITLDVKKKTTYRLSFWFKVTEYNQKDGASKPYVVITDSKNATIKATWFGGVSDGWQQGTIDVAIGDIEQAKIRIVTGSNLVDVFKMYVDDVEFKELR